MWRAACVGCEVKDGSNPTCGVFRRFCGECLEGSAEIRCVGLLNFWADVLQVPRGRREQEEIVRVKHLVLMDQQLLAPIGHPDVPVEARSDVTEDFLQMVFRWERGERRAGDFGVGAPGECRDGG